MASDILPSPDETRPAYLRRQITERAERLEDHRRQRNAKVEQMALAHCAMKNLVGGLILVAVLGTYLAVTAKNQDENLLRTLKQDRVLYEMRRDPQSTKGDPGPPGNLDPKQPSPLQRTPIPSPIER